MITRLIINLFRIKINFNKRGRLELDDKLQLSHLNQNVSFLSNTNKGFQFAKNVIFRPIHSICIARCTKTLQFFYKFHIIIQSLQFIVKITLHILGSLFSCYPFQLTRKFMYM